MRRILALLTICTLFLVSASAVLAQSATVAVSPASAAQGSSHSITASGLSPNRTYTVDFVYSATGEVIFTTDRTSNDSGSFVLNIRSSESDAPGIYLVEVRDGDQIVAETTFEITGGPGPAQPATPVPPVQNTPVPTPLPATIAQVRVIPASAPQNNTHEILVTGLNAGQATNVVITASATGEVLYNKRWNADEAGRLQVEIFTTRETPPDVYRVEVRDLSGGVLGGSSFIVQEPVGRNASVTVNPASGSAEVAREINISSAKPFTDLNVEIVDSEGVQLSPNSLIFQTIVRSDVEGAASIRWTPSELAEGAYSVVVKEGSIEIGRAILLIGDAPASSISVEVTPETAERGSSFSLAVRGLAPEAAFTLRVVYVMTEELIYSAERQADANGEYSTVLSSSDDDRAGAYRIEIVENNLVTGTGELRLQSPSVVTVTVTPRSANVGATHIIAASGLQAGEVVTVRILRGSEVIATREATADVNGAIAVSIGDTAGATESAYVAEIVRGGNAIARAEFTVGQPASVALNITPSSGPQGTAHTIEVSGLTPDELITIDLVLNGRTVFAAERRADVAGNASLSLRSEASDLPGIYDVRVRRGEQIVAQNTLEIEATTAAQPSRGSATLSITPEEAPADSIYTVDVTDLTPGDEILLRLSYQGVVVLEMRRVADENGSARAILRSNPNDRPGEYVMVILRNGVVIAEGSLRISEGPATTEAPVIVRVTPESGPIGTSHAVVIEGLQPNETIGIEVRFGDSLEYSTQRSADAQGVASINLIASEDDEPGTYVVTVLRQGTPVARARLIVEGEQADVPATPPPSGDVIVREGILTTESPMQDTTFTGEAGDLIYITQRSEDFDSYLILLDNMGNELAYNDDSSSGLDSAIGPFRLPYTGSYTVRSSSYDYMELDSAIGGRYTLIIEPVRLEALPLNQDVVVEFIGGTITRFFEFDAALGDKLNIRVDSGGSLDTLVELLGPNGEVIAGDDDSGAGYDPELLNVPISSSGRYTLLVQTFTPGDEGHVRLRVERVEPADLDTGAQVVRLNAKNNNSMLQLAGRAGETVQLNLTVQAGRPRSVGILVTQGSTTLMEYESEGIPSRLMLGFVVAQNGPVTIEVRSFSSSVIEVGIQRLEP